jgi:hypothetical protein
MKHIRKISYVVMGLALLALALAGCRRTPDEARVRAAISQIAQAAEAGAPRDVVAPLSDDFDGNAGELDRLSLANLVRLAALRGDHVRVATGPVAIEHRGERLVATLTVTLTGGGGLLPDHLGVYRIESAWRKQDGRWLCYSATWEQL